MRPTLFYNHMGNFPAGGRKDGEDPGHMEFCKKCHCTHLGHVCST